MKTLFYLSILFPFYFSAQQKSESTGIFASKEMMIIRENFANDIVFINPKKPQKHQNHYGLISDYFHTGSLSTEKIAKVLGHSGWGLINEKGTEILPPIYFQIHDFQNGIGRVTFSHPNERDKFFMETRDTYINFKGNFLQPKFSADGKAPPAAGFFFENFAKNDLYILREENSFSGVFDKDLKNIIPTKYNYFVKGDNFIIAYHDLDSHKKREFDIYNLQGKLLKKLTYLSLTNFKNLLIATDEQGSFFLDTNTFLPHNNFRFDFYHEINDSKIAILKAFQIIDKTNTSKYRDNTKSYFIDHNLKIINIDFHTSELYEDRFLIQHDHNQSFGHETENIKIISLDGMLMADYSIKDFQLYHYFCPDKLPDKAYLESRKKEWQNYTLVDTSITTPQKYNDFRLAYTKNKDGNADKISVFDIKTGNCKFSLQAPEFGQIYPLSDRNHFVAHSKDHISITDAKGNIIKKIQSENIYNYTKDILIRKYEGKYDFLDAKTFEDLYKVDFKSIYETDEQKNYLLVYDGKNYGFINLKTKKLEMTKYRYGSVQNSYILLYDQNSLEVLDKKNAKTLQKIQFKNNYFTSRDIGSYHKGLFIFNDYDFVADQYGNLLDMHQIATSPY